MRLNQTIQDGKQKNNIQHKGKQNGHI